MARLANRRRDETFHTPASMLIDPDFGRDDNDTDLSTFLALSIPRVFDRQQSARQPDEVRNV